MGDNRDRQMILRASRDLSSYHDCCVAILPQSEEARICLSYLEIVYSSSNG